MSRPLSVNHSSRVFGCQSKPTVLRTPSANTSRLDPSGFIRNIAAVIGGDRQTLHVEQIVGSEGDELPRVTGVRIREIITDDDRGWWRIEAFFDVVEPQDLALGHHIQRAVVHSDSIGLIETAGDYNHAISFVVAVAIDDRVDLAYPRSDEHRAPRTERHLSRVPDTVSEHRDVKSGGKIGR